MCTPSRAARNKNPSAIPMKLPVLHMPVSLASKPKRFIKGFKKHARSSRRRSDRMKRKPVVICCSVLLALIVVLAVVFVALYFTVFRPRSPHVVATVVSSRVSQFNVTLDFPIVPPKFNMSMDVDVTVKNPNYAAFRYGDVVTELTYHGLPVGQSVVLAGEVGARTTQTVGATVVVQADKVIFTDDFIQDVLPKLFDLPDVMLPFKTRTTVAGKAVVLGTFKIRASSAVTCSISTYPAKQEITSDCTSTVNIG